MLFTVFTAVYNRRELIHRVWDSLRAQTVRDFEWVVVDDGSADNVVEVLEEYAARADFPLRFERIEHGGKHAAWNRGMQLVRGELVIPVDSDDSFAPHALERLRDLWLSIPQEERAAFSGVNVLCVDPSTGKVEGDRFPKSPLISNNLELAYVLKVAGGKWGCIRSDLLRALPFPTGPGLKGSCVSENYLWYQLARKYKVLCANEPLHFYHHDAGNSVTVLNAASGLRGRLTRSVATNYFYKSWHLNTNLDYLFRDKKDLLKTLIDIWLCGLGSGRSIRKILADSAPGKPFLLRLLGFPAGLAAYAYCKIAGRGTEGPLDNPLHNRPSRGSASLQE